jgi:hypothetical protein
MEKFITAATEGGGVFASFGSGDTAGRTQASARGSAGRTKASPAQVRAARAAINRSNLTRANKRQLLSDIDENSSGRTRTPSRRVLANILDDLNDLRR